MRITTLDGEQTSRVLKPDAPALDLEDHSPAIADYLVLENPVGERGNRCLEHAIAMTVLAERVIADLRLTTPRADRNNFV